MSDSYYFEFSTGQIRLKCRSFEGIGRAEHTTVYSTPYTPEAEGILESLTEALNLKKTYDAEKIDDDIERLEKELQQTQITLESKRKERERLNPSKNDKN